MHPALSFAVGEQQLQLASYGLLLSLAALVAAGVGFAVAVRQGLPWARVLACLLAMVIAVPVGARLLDAATKWGLYLQEPDRLWRMDFEGFSMLGGLLLAGAAGAAACRLLSLPAARTADAVAPGLWLGVAITRLGCYLAGCCFGEVTSAPWGATFPIGSPAHLHQIVQSLRALPPLPVHPTQLYEMAAALACAGLAAGLLRSRAPDGAAFLASVCAFAAFRLLNHQFRVPGPALAVPEWFYPALYVSIMLAAGAALLRHAAVSRPPRRLSSAWLSREATDPGGRSSR
jgi:phosphatidylglycerol---prolipoprotein diacylglyceryl transferase